LSGGRIDPKIGTETNLKVTSIVPLVTARDDLIKFANVDMVNTGNGGTMATIKTGLQARMREKHLATGRGNRSIRLPSSLELSSSESSSTLRMKLNAESTVANMQTNAAAFEAWALALHLWADVGSIEFDWDVPADAEVQFGGHYQRFLYRVARFESLFPWFVAVDHAKLSGSRALHGKKLILNVASKSRSVNGDDVRNDSGLKTGSEAALECQLVSSPHFSLRFNLTKVDRQFPVGLFEGSVSGKNRIFTGGKSAIDIVGVAPDGFWLFELKAGNNIPMGTLSELLFYASVIRDAAGPAARFSFGERSKNQGSSKSIVTGQDVRNCGAINAVILVQQLHPLLEHHRLIDALNDAANANWNNDPAGTPPVTFHLAIVPNPDTMSV
jgi:hypothetical protein